MRETWYLYKQTLCKHKQTYITSRRIASKKINTRCYSLVALHLISYKPFLSTTPELRELVKCATACTTPTPSATDCADLLAEGHSASGVYNIRLTPTNKTIKVYCDMRTDGGGWLVSIYAMICFWEFNPPKYYLTWLSLKKRQKYVVPSKSF